MTRPAPPPPSDLGFGSAVARESRARLLNRDGSFNVRRAGLGFFESWSAYYFLLSVSWPRFLLLVAAVYAAANALFAGAFLLLGPDAIAGPETPATLAGQFARAYFFSVQTIATIGYGHLSPRGLGANLLVAGESLTGLLGLALVAGIAFARFARPVAMVRFSDVALVAPYRGGSAFMFRIANVRESELLEVGAKVSLSRRRPGGAANEREFHELRLERDGVTFFPLSWTIVHPIDETSPLWGIGAEELRESDPEFLVYLTALDETFAQQVHARRSYKADEIVHGARFRSIIERGATDGTVRVDVRNISAIERIGD